MSEPDGKVQLPPSPPLGLNLLIGSVLAQEAQNLLEDLDVVEKLDEFIRSALESIERSRDAELSELRKQLAPYFDFEAGKDLPDSTRGVSVPPAHLLERAQELRKPALYWVRKILARALKEEIDRHHRTIGSAA